MVDVATGWTECLPLVTRESGLVVEAMARAQSLFPWLIVGADFDNASAFMNDIVVPWCRTQKIEVTRSRAYKKNDQAFVEQKNGAVVRRLVGYGRFDGVETAKLIARLYAAARLHVNFFQPSFKLKDKRREGAKVIKRYHAPATPYARALAHPKVGKAVKQRLREIYRTLDPVALLAEVRAAQTELGTRVDRRGTSDGAAAVRTPSPAPDAAKFAKGLGKTIQAGEPRATRRQHQATLQDASSHALNTRSASGRHPELACRRASADRDRHPRPAEQPGAGGVRPTATLDRPEATQDAADQGRASVDRRQSGSR